ncbi:MAG TPA: DsrE family protein [Bacteriovoracaceae bacterium]|nr:DsrE family protein [Bacteriovoracaceae bacterium]
MKKLFLLMLFMFTVVSHASDYKVVFELTSDNPKHWETLLNNLENVKKDLGPKTKMEVVVHGNGMGVLLKRIEFQKRRMTKIVSEGVQFLACENTLRRRGIKREELYDFAKTVPAGLGEIIRKQKEGWAYIKIGP